MNSVLLQMKADFPKASPFLIVLLFNPFPFLVKARKSNADCTRSPGKGFSEPLCPVCYFRRKLSG